MYSVECLVYSLFNKELYENNLICFVLCWKEYIILKIERIRFCENIVIDFWFIDYWLWYKYVIVV